MLEISLLDQAMIERSCLVWFEHDFSGMFDKFTMGKEVLRPEDINATKI